MTDSAKKKNKLSSTQAKNNFVARILLQITKIFNAITLIPVILALLAPYIPSDSWAIPSLCALLMPYLAIIPMIWLIVWGFFSLPFAVLNLLVILAFYNTFQLSLQFHTSRKAKDTDFTAISFNVRAFQYKKKELIKVANFLKTQAPDIVCFQEFREELDRGAMATNFLKDELNLKHSAFVELLPGSTFGLAVFSRYPINNFGRITDQTNATRNGVMYADLALYGQTLRLYNFHLESYRLDNTQKTMFQEQSSFAQKVSSKRYKFVKEDKFSVRKYWKTAKSLMRTWEKQTPQINAFVKHIEKKKSELVLACGDLNNPPYTYAYNAVRGDLKDSFIEKGYGFGKTYGLGAQSLRIDYQFADPKIQIIDFQTIPTDSVSDHAALVARYRFGFHQ